MWQPCSRLADRANLRRLVILRGVGGFRRSVFGVWCLVGRRPTVVRVMMHANLEVGLTEVKHIYLKGAAVLRKDLAQ